MSRRRSSTTIPESAIQDIWGQQLFESGNLQTTDYREVRVVNPGQQNRDAGPDFLAAQVWIDGLRWFGDVEIHISSGVWYEHHHESDARYNNVVLHVVLYSDFWTGKVRRQDGTVIPEIVLKPRISEPVGRLMHKLNLTAGDEIPCGSQLHRVPGEVTGPWIARLARRRLERRMNAHAGSDAPARQEVLRKALFRALGYSKNGDAMGRLFESASKYYPRLDSRMEFEALSLGLAGLLPDSPALADLSGDNLDYAYTLITAFNRLAILYNFVPMSASEWTFFRLRPANFPRIRIGQAACLMYRSYSTGTFLTYDHFKHLLSTDNPLVEFQQALNVKIHRFYANRRSRLQRPELSGPGSARTERIIINAIIPYMMLEAAIDNDETVTFRVLRLMQKLRPENDRIMRYYAEKKCVNRNAFDSQGLHELNQNYCRRLRCLACEIGSFLIHNDTTDFPDDNIPSCL